jgi:hypothetical protein
MRFELPPLARPDVPASEDGALAAATTRARA